MSPSIGSILRILRLGTLFVSLHSLLPTMIVGSYGHELVLPELRLYKGRTQWRSSINFGEVITLHSEPYMSLGLKQVWYRAVVDDAVGYGGESFEWSSWRRNTRNRMCRDTL